MPTATPRLLIRAVLETGFAACGWLAPASCLVACAFNSFYKLEDHLAALRNQRSLRGDKAELHTWLLQAVTSLASRRCFLKWASRQNCYWCGLTVQSLYENLRTR